MIIDLVNAQIGDKFWSIQLGDCKISNIVNINPEFNYPIVLINKDGLQCSYTTKGLCNCNDMNPSLFLNNPLTSNTEFPKWMMVSCGNGKPLKRFVLYKEGSKYKALIKINDEQDLNNDTTLWDKGKDLDEIVELTLKQIATKFNLNISQIKII